MGYGEALERQLQLRCWVSDRGLRTLAVILEGADEDPRYAKGNLPVFGVPLFSGECFFVSTPICTLVQTASESLPPSWVWGQEVWPSICAFVWLETPIRFAGSLGLVHAISWAPLVADAGGEGMLPLRIAGQIREGGEDITTPVDWPPISEAKAMALTFWVYPLGLRLPAPTVVIIIKVNGALGVRDWMQRVDAQEPHNRESSMGKLRFLAAFLAFLQQRLLSSSAEPPSRATRRRLDRILRGSDALPERINVIQLRKQQVDGPSQPSGGSTTWSCQWIVRGHWRNQWYARRRRHQPKWITAYVKGPEDKPLRTPRRLFAVVR